MVKFLHLADVHLGFDRYDSRERTKDFFRAFQDVLHRYAIEARVDFVLIAGDLFEHRSLQPAILNQAQLCLQALKAADIPVFAIEGNHDNRPYGVVTSWLKYLSEWRLLTLLEPGNVAAGESFYCPWDDERRQGGYIDLACGVRILGSNWYGAAAPRAIEQIATAIAELPPGPEHTVLMFHHGLEGQIARYAGALRYHDLLPLRQVGVDYLALGHIHKNYSVDGWVYNPGSLEANNVEEAQYERGAYLVELNGQGVQAQLQRDYYQRPITRLRLLARGQESVDELAANAIRMLDEAIARGQVDPTQAPLLEFRIEGQVGFDRLEFDTRALQHTLKQRSNAIICLLKYEVETVGYASPLATEASRGQIEYDIFTDVLASHRDYKKRASDLAHGLMDLKERQLQGHSEDALYTFVETLLDLDPQPTSSCQEQDPMAED